MEKKYTNNTQSRYHFRFKSVPVDTNLERKTHLRLAEFLAIAPPGARAVGFVEKSDRFYTCAIEISSPYRNFFEKAGGLTPQSAVRRALERLENQLYQWRYGGGSSGGYYHSGLHYNQTQSHG